MNLVASWLLSVSIKKPSITCTSAPLPKFQKSALTIFLNRQSRLKYRQSRLLKNFKVGSDDILGLFSKYRQSQLLKFFKSQLWRNFKSQLWRYLFSWFGSELTMQNSHFFFFSEPNITNTSAVAKRCLITRCAWNVMERETETERKERERERERETEREREREGERETKRERERESRLESSLESRRAADERIVETWRNSVDSIAHVVGWGRYPPSQTKRLAKNLDSDLIMIENGHEWLFQHCWYRILLGQITPKTPIFTSIQKSGLGKNPGFDGTWTWVAVLELLVRKSRVTQPDYGVATISRLLQIIGLFCRISSLYSWNRVTQPEYHLMSWVTGSCKCICWYIFEEKYKYIFLLVGTYLRKNIHKKVIDVDPKW